MANLKIFGKRKTESKKKTEQKSELAQESKEGFKRRGGVSGGAQIVRPHITEKATELGSTKNQYVFVVQDSAAKKEIKKAVEKMYGVTVERVRIVNVHPKKVKLGKTKGIKKGYKKAIVQVKEGQKIEILPT